MEKNYILCGYHIRLFVDLMYGYRDIKITKNDKVVSYYTDEEVCVDGMEEKDQDKFIFTEDDKENLIDEVKFWLKLCPNKRVAKVMACVMGGMKYYQVAEKLKISLSMVKHDYQRGIEYLKECMVTK